MKKILTGIMAVILLFTLFGTNASAKTDDMDKLMQSVERTNAEINIMIDKAVSDAEILIQRYEQNISRWCTSVKAQEFDEHISVVKYEFGLIKEANGDSEVIGSKIDAVEEKLANIEMKAEASIRCIYCPAEQLTSREEESYIRFNQQLDNIICSLIDKTNRKAENLIKEGLKYGITIEPEWIEVEIGGRIILVDPLRVRGL